jgi:phospholipid/cholesterol/gamma-HCH transport system ATP-binding protein
MSKAEKPLVIHGLKAGYGSNLVLDGVDMEVPYGEIRVILGGSGCGKSTLLRNAIGLERPKAGTVQILGEAIDWSEGRPTGQIFSQVGVLFQNGALLSSLTVAENVALPLRLHRPDLPASVREEIVRIKLEQVRLGHALHKLPGELSGGMRKRAGMARALALDPPLLFCDEPSAGLDPVTSRGLDELLLELRENLGITMIVVTHELDSIRSLADSITFLSQKRVAYDGPLRDAETQAPEEVRAFLAREAEPTHEVENSGRTNAFHLEG